MARAGRIKQKTYIFPSWMPKIWRRCHNLSFFLSKYMKITLFHPVRQHYGVVTYSNAQHYELGNIFLRLLNIAVVAEFVIESRDKCKKKLLVY